MKPLLIDVQAFGSYAVRQTIDFACLDGERFFLVWGPTGSGKTTIFDAMCYALYGVSSAGERDGSQMRSHLAQQALQTEVTFDFSLGPKTYRVHRRPRQQLPKRRGEGLTEVEAKAELWTLEAGQETQLIATQMRGVTEAVERLLGFRADQFRQVVVLPQGRFERLLKANSRDRQDLLEALFNTHNLSRIEQALKTRAKAAEQDAKVLHATRKTILTEAGAISQQALEAKIKAGAPKLSKLKVSVEKASKKVSDLQRSLETARKRHATASEYRAAKQALAELKQRAKAMKQRKISIASARKLLPLVERHRALSTLERESSQLEQQQQQVVRALAEAQVEQRSTADQLGRQRSNEGARRKASRECERLRVMQTTVTALQAVTAQCEGLELELKSRRKQWRRAKQTLEQECRKHDRLEKRITEAEQIAGHVGSHRAAWEAAERAIEQRRALDNHRAKLKQFDKRIADQKEIVQAAQERLESLERAYDAELEQRLITRLRQQIADGQSCAVCGSDSLGQVKDHLSSPKHIAAATLAREREAMDDVEQVLATLERERFQTHTRAEAVVELLGLASRQQLAELETQAKILKQEFQRREKARDKIDGLREELDQLKQAIGLSRQEIDKAAEARAQAQSRLAEARALLGERRKQVPARLRDAKILAKALTQAEQQLDQLRRDLARAEDLAREHQSRVATLEQQNKDLQKRVADSKARAELLASALESSCSALGVSRDVLEQEQASAEQLEDLDAEVRSYEQAYAAAEARLARAGTPPKGRLPDLEALAAKQQDANERRDVLVRNEAQLENELSQAEARRSRLQDVETELERLEQWQAVIARVAAVASGRNPRRLTFQRFVQAALLDDVLLAASARLHHMTRRRYSLRRAERNRGGLDLEVLDSFSGTARAPATLSGGETFLASLALALGLAEVVQRYAGGVRLDTLFIDEGFGGLDSEALDQALSALHQLQSAGKQIGIISHVAELRERIDARLEVTTGPQGSRARFVHGA